MMALVSKLSFLLSLSLSSSLSFGGVNFLTGSSTATAWTLNSLRHFHPSCYSWLPRGGAFSASRHVPIMSATSPKIDQDSPQTNSNMTKEEDNSHESFPTKSNVVKVIGIMGGIGSGKSTASQWLMESFQNSSQLQIHYLEADSIARGLYTPYSPVVQQIQAALGDDMVQDDGHINRAALAKTIFENPQARETVERIVWPLTKQVIQEEIDLIATAEGVSSSSSPNSHIILLEAAMLLEADWEDMLDALWVVTVSPEVAVRRLVEGSRGLALEDVQRRMADQSTRRGMGDLLQKEIDAGIVTAVLENNESPQALETVLQKTLEKALRSWEIKLE